MKIELDDSIISDEGPFEITSVEAERLIRMCLGRMRKAKTSKTKTKYYNMIVKLNFIIDNEKWIGITALPKNGWQGFVKTKSGKVFEAILSDSVWWQAKKPVRIYDVMYMEFK